MPRGIRLVAVSLLSLSGPAAVPQGVVSREVVVASELNLAAGVVRLQYQARAYAPESFRKMRRDAQFRAQQNDVMPLFVQGELSLPSRVQVGSEVLEKGRYRTALAMNDAGAWEFRILMKDRRFRDFPLANTEGDQVFDYLCLSLAPSSEGLFAVIVQWGPEYGRLVFHSP